MSESKNLANEKALLLAAYFFGHIDELQKSKDTLELITESNL